MSGDLAAATTTTIGRTLSRVIHISPLKSTFSICIANISMYTSSGEHQRMVLRNGAKGQARPITTSLMIGLLVVSCLLDSIHGFIGGLPSLPSQGIVPRARSELQTAPNAGSNRQGGYGRQSIIMMPSSAPLVRICT